MEEPAKSSNSELCRGLILENGSTVALFSCCHVVVIEPDGSCFSVVSKGRPNAQPLCVSHPVRFTPSKFRHLVTLALRFRNLHAESPFIPSWLANISESSEQLLLLKHQPFVWNPQHHPRKRCCHIVHWPLEPDMRFIKWNESGGVEVYSIEGTAKLSLCHLAQRVSVMYSVYPTNEANTIWGYNSAHKPDKSTEDSNKKKPHENVALVTQLFSLRQIPNCFEVPARLALSVFHTQHGKENPQESVTMMVPAKALGVNDSSRNKAKYINMESKMMEKKADLKPLPVYSPPTPLPTSPPPSVPSWESIDSSDGLHLHRNPAGTRSFQYDENDKYSPVASSRYPESEYDEHTRDLIHRLLPSQLLELAKRARGFDIPQVQSTSRSLLGTENESHLESEELYPISRHCSVIEWSPKATYRAFQSADMSDGVAVKRTNVVIEIAIHEDESFIVLDGDYAIHYTRHNISRDDIKDQKEETLCPPGFKQCCYHVNMSHHIMIEDKYRLGSFVEKGLKLAAQFLCHPENSTRPLHDPQHKELETQRTVLLPEHLLNQSFSDPYLSGTIASISQSSEPGVVFKKKYPHVTLYAYLDGSCRGCFKDSSMVRLQWREVQRQASSFKKLSIGTIHLITPSGSACSVEYYNNDTLSESRTTLIREFIPHLRLMIWFAKWATASAEERVRMDLEQENRQLMVARQLKRNTLFIEREKMEQEIKQKSLERKHKNVFEAIR